MGYVDFSPTSGGVTSGVARSAMRDLPSFSLPREVETIYEGGRWQLSPADKFGDGTFILDRSVVPPVFRCVYRTGSAPVGGVYVEKEYGDLYSGWTIPGGPTTPDKAIISRDPTSAGNVDTYNLFVNPITGVITCQHGVRPGTRDPGDTGYIGSIQRHTTAPPYVDLNLETSWTDYGAEHLLKVEDPPATWHVPREVAPLGAPFEWEGGIDESSIVYDPSVPGEEIVLFYEAQSIDTSDSQWGTTWKNRLGRAVAPLSGFDVSPTITHTPALGPTSWVFDPQYLPGYTPSPGPSPWGTMTGLTQRGHVSVHPYDGSFHLLILGQKPNTVILTRNESLGIGHWWSHDRGKTWTGDVNNPVIDLAYLYDRVGWTPEVGNNRLNSPSLLWDTIANKFYIMFYGNPIGVQGDLGTRLWAAMGSF